MCVCVCCSGSQWFHVPQSSCVCDTVAPYVPKTGHLPCHKDILLRRWRDPVEFNTRVRLSVRAGTAFQSTRYRALGGDESKDRQYCTLALWKYCFDPVRRCYAYVDLCTTKTNLVSRVKDTFTKPQGRKMRQIFSLARNADSLRFLCFALSSFIHPVFIQVSPVEVSNLLCKRTTTRNSDLLPECQ